MILILSRGRGLDAGFWILDSGFWILDFQVVLLYMPGQSLIYQLTTPSSPWKPVN